MASMARRTICGLALALALALAAPAELRAQNASPPSPAVDPFTTPRKRRSTRCRKPIAGDPGFHGLERSLSGRSRRRLRQAHARRIVAYQASVKAPPSGIVDAAQLAAMASAAQKARAAVRFQIFTDDKTGVKIGAPLKDSRQARRQRIGRRAAHEGRRLDHA